MKVEVVVAEAHELSRDKKYLIGLDARYVSDEQAHSLLESLRDIGIHNSVVLVAPGNPKDTIKVIEQEV